MCVHRGSSHATGRIHPCQVRPHPGHGGQVLGHPPQISQDMRSAPKQPSTSRYYSVTSKTQDIQKAVPEESVDHKIFLDSIDLFSRAEGAWTEWVLYLCVRGDQVCGGHHQ